MENELFERICKFLVSEYFNNHREKTDRFVMCTSDVFIVWSCKTLQNNKAMVSTTVSDGMYYEITYNGDKKQFYLDAYKKWENQPHELSDITERLNAKCCDCECSCDKEEEHEDN